MQNELTENFERFLAIKHPGINISDLEPTETPGYWQLKTPCGGRAGGCKHPIHRVLFNEGPCCHTISFFDCTRGKDGRFASPYRTWEVFRRQAGPGGERP